jgi:ribosomal-protein-serine acetyltransferase
MTEAARACVDFALIARLKFHFEGIARQAEYVDARWVDHAVFARLATDP